MKNKLITNAFESGLTQNHEDVIKSFSKNEWSVIKTKLPYISMAMEIRKLRFETKTSQIELARLTKVKREFISRLESGKQNMTLITIIKIAQAMRKEFKFSFE